MPIFPLISCDRSLHSPSFGGGNFLKRWIWQEPSHSQVSVEGLEVLAQRSEARSVEEFREGLQCLKERTAWTSGEWELSGEVRRWNSLQNVNRDVALLKHYLIAIVKADQRSRRKSAPLPLLEPEAGTL